MRSSTILAIAALFSSKALAQWTEQPPTTANPNTISTCTYWRVIVSGDSCASIADLHGITLSQFQLYNPSVVPNCNLVIGNSYCIENNYGLGDPTTTPPPGTPTTTSATSTSASPTGNGVSTPTPFQPGMTTNCNRFYFVQSGDGCPAVAATFNIALSDFYSWNPGVGSNCNFLWLDTYVCVGVIGGTTSTSRPPTTTTRPAITTAGNGIVTPTPIQTGMTTNCNKFYFVQENDSCPVIAANNNIALASFYTWNPAVGSNCNTMWTSTYVCVGIIGGTTLSTTTRTTTTTPTTTTGNGIATPTPYLPGSATNCDAFHFVVSGDTCDTIVMQRGVSKADFLRFNPSIPADCRTGLWLDTYVCISIIGHTLSTITTTTTRAPTTTRGNGITTPTPYQPGMVTNCDTFEFVNSGETCAIIAAARGVSVADIVRWNPGVGSSCQTMWVDAYICVGLI